MIEDVYILKVDENNAEISINMDILDNICGFYN